MTDEGVSPLGQNLARYRKAEGLSASELADQVGLGLTRSVIANLENGRKDDVTVKQLIALGNALRIPPAFLVVDIFTPGQPSPYPLPDSSYPDINWETFEREEKPSQKRNADFLAWFGGQAMYVSEDGLSGAALLAEEAHRKLTSYRFAWRNFSNAVYRLSLLTEPSEGEDLASEEELTHATQAVSDSASHVLLWVAEMKRSGIQNDNTEPLVRQILARLRIPLPDELVTTLDG